MKRTLLFILLLVCSIPSFTTYAADYDLKKNKKIEGSYAGDDAEVYNYYKIISSKDGFIAITVATSDKAALMIDICDENKEVVASDISIKHKGMVLHKVKKNMIYYIRIKGSPDNTYTISYKMKDINSLSYAKEYNYTFSNASFKNKANPIILKIKTNMSGNLNFMCKTDNRLMIQYLNNKKKVISSDILLQKSNLSGIGVNAKKVYYIKMWNQENLTSGTTTISNMKYQIDSIINSNNSARNKSYVLTKNKYKESLVVADKKSMFWYKVNLSKNQKLSIYVESRMMQMNGSCLQLDLYNRNGEKITSESIIIDEESYATYKKKKYKMNYPVKKITTGELPADTYYIKIESKNKKTSGSFRIKWD